MALHSPARQHWYIWVQNGSHIYSACKVVSQQDMNSWPLPQQILDQPPPCHRSEMHFPLMSPLVLLFEHVASSQATRIGTPLKPSFLESRPKVPPLIYIFPFWCCHNYITVTVIVHHHEWSMFLGQHIFIVVKDEKSVISQVWTDSSCPLAVTILVQDCGYGWGRG